MGEKKHAHELSMSDHPDFLFIKRKYNFQNVSDDEMFFLCSFFLSLLQQEKEQHVKRTWLDYT